MMRHLSLLLLLLIQINLHGLDNGFTFHCPFPSQWNFRAKGLCHLSDGYHCLYDANKVQNIEACRDGPQFEAPGNKLQIVGSLEVVKCTNERYQPFIFWTNGSHLCKFEKSFCTDEGQVLFSQGTTKKDSTCRCDYTKGYDFVTKPRNTCFCIPTEEDCSCFIRHCSSGLVLSPDYKCVPVIKLLEISQCPITTSSAETTKRPTLSIDKKDDTHTYYNDHVFRIHKVVLLVLLLLVTGMGIIYFLYICHVGKSTIEKNSWKDHLMKFVTTRASQEILITITKNPCVLITGPFGSGKTTIACYISSMLAKEGYETNFVSNPEEIMRLTYRNRRQLFIIDDVFGKYSTNISDITERSEKYGSSINAILTKSGTVKVLITSRTYIYQLNFMSFENLKTAISFIHKDLIPETSELDLEERRKMYKSYFESDPPKSISDDILSLYHFYPVMCASYNKDNVLQYFTHPVDIISAEIDSMQQKSDIGYLALAILVVMGNKVEISHISGLSYSERTDFILRDIFNESCFNHYPSIHMLYVTFKSLNGDFIKNGDTFFSFDCPELFEIVAKCIGGSFMQSILKNSSSVFIKERLRLSTTEENNCSHTIRVPHTMIDAFYQRLTSDINNNLIFDVLSNKIFESQYYRKTFIGYLNKHVKSNTLVDSSTRSNVLHIVSSFGYSDFLNHFLTRDKGQGVNKKNINGKTPLHLACQNGHMNCVQCLLNNTAVVNDTDSKKRTALHYACEAGNESIVKYLITNNASVNNKDLEGMTPLHVACEKGHQYVVKFLVEKKVNINEADTKDKTPLHYACEHRFWNIAEVLILNKAYVNKSDEQGSTPLHIACEYGNAGVVKLLVEYKAVTNSKNKNGLTPLDISLKNGIEAVSICLSQFEKNK
ncbi:uncharacterized protein LOC127715390 isoform X2 [Mytilus californianus]|uniref:uncharacterized protein LOC127715390 isoform X2 n=1 Tax=Mytilus californianus TaxID=6549 RepID=UPI002245720D|nr:uncharacterized protein LOC127715390 isoform X2 [Mytilus californianus]